MFTCLCHIIPADPPAYSVCVFFCSCGLNSQAGPAGVSGADPAAQAKGGYSERRHGGAEPAEALRHHVLWCERGRKVHQPGQGEGIRRSLTAYA